MHGNGNTLSSSILASAADARGRSEDNAANASGLSNSEERLRQDPQALAFFQRSLSTLSLACDPPDPFSRPLASALPLAERPHLLVPGAARDDLFGLSVESWMMPTEANVPPGAWARPPLALALGFASSATPTPDAAGAPSRLVLRLAAHCTGGGIRALLRRWRLTLELFSRHFLEDVGAEPGSLLPDLSELAAFTIKGEFILSLSLSLSLSLCHDCDSTTAIPVHTSTLYVYYILRLHSPVPVMPLSYLIIYNEELTILLWA